MGNMELALEDLNKSLELNAGPQALCQRGLIYLKLKKEDLAKEDFKRASNMGSQFAKTILIQVFFGLQKKNM